MTKKELKQAMAEIQFELDREELIDKLESQIQTIWDLIGDLQKGKIGMEDIPDFYKEGE